MSSDSVENRDQLQALLRDLFPDFILWLQNENHQHIVFIEPHGYVMEGEPLEDHRVKMHRGIKEIEDDLDGPGDETISLHSYVVSRTGLNGLRERSRADTRREFHQEGIYFQNEIEDLITDIFD